uniref:Uncharacterized protein n=1 Tax=Oryza meridionalis TaxID=40149 RepID=A0A0E0D1Q4_9ORYZ
MPLAAAAAAVAVASAVVPPRPPPPPPRRARPLRSFTGLVLTRDLAALTVARCAPSPPAPAAEAEAVDEAPPAKPRPRRYPRQYPGEAVGVAEEMRFVAMRLRNPKRTTLKMDDTGAEEEVGDGVSEDASASEEEDDDVIEEEEEGEGAGLEGEWMPSMEGFVKYLVDSKLVFDTVERIVAESTDISKKILEGRELEFYKWDSDVELLLKDTREKLNELSKHWSRKDRNLCLKEAAKCFQYLGRISDPEGSSGVRLKLISKHYPGD